MSKRYGNKYINNPEDCLIDLYRKRGEVYRLIGNYDQSYNDFCRMKITALMAKDENKQAEAITQIGNVFLHKSEFEKAETYFANALNLYQKSDNQKGEAECYKQLGKLMQYHEENQKALEYYNSSFKIFSDLKDDDGKYLVLEHIADGYRLSKKYDDALNILEQLSNYYGEKANKVKLSHVYQTFGNLYCEVGKKEEGLTNLKKSFDLAKQTGDKVAIVYLLCSLGLAQYDNCLYSEAKEYFESCFALSQKQKISYMSAVSLLNLGDTCIKMNDSNTARINLHKVLAMDINIEGIKNEANRLLKQINSD
jgi:tetratricopeptide (TPR) repeat protein